MYGGGNRMNVCARCKREMRCKKNGIIVRYGIGHCYAGDKFECPECGAEVVICNQAPFFSDKEPNKDILLQMD